MSLNSLVVNEAITDKLGLEDFLWGYGTVPQVRDGDFVNIIAVNADHINRIEGLIEGPSVGAALGDILNDKILPT